VNAASREEFLQIAAQHSPWQMIAVERRVEVSLQGLESGAAEHRVVVLSGT